MSTSPVSVSLLNLSPQAISLRLGRWFCFALILIALFGLAAQQAATQEGEGQPGSMMFQIPSQPLVTALQAYSQTSGVEVLYESRIADGLQSAPVEGPFTPETALRLLLAHTDIAVHYNRSNAITLSLPADEHLPPASPLQETDLQLETMRVSGGQALPSEQMMREFGESVQFDIEAALRKEAETWAGNYRIKVRLWVDPSRTIRKAELAQSTGDSDRDVRIAQVLQGIVLRRTPPANVPQPLRVVIVVRSL